MDKKNMSILGFCMFCGEVRVGVRVRVRDLGFHFHFSELFVVLRRRCPPPMSDWIRRRVE